MIQPVVAAQEVFVALMVARGDQSGLPWAWPTLCFRTHNRQPVLPKCRPRPDAGERDMLRLEVEPPSADPLDADGLIDAGKEVRIRQDLVLTALGKRAADK